MATYAIGDIQGCYREFLGLLEAVQFDSRRDRLWLTGDLVNRGPESLAVLREVVALGDRAVAVLGNHDLHLLACACVRGLQPRRKDTLDEVLAAPDLGELLDWLRHQPLIHQDTELGFTLIHAGLPPVWTVNDAVTYADEVTGKLRGGDLTAFLAGMYGDTPDRWDPMLRGNKRLRFITNCFTRMRYCDARGRLNLDEKGAPRDGSRLRPWFELPDRASRCTRILVNLALERGRVRAPQRLPARYGRRMGRAAIGDAAGRRPALPDPVVTGGTDQVIRSNTRKR
jgi:bis(5'-nucleosyl)-tetraphosphatase (symmetrical)